MELEIEATEVFQDNYDALYDSERRFIVNEGGSRSSKTYSICQLIILYCYNNNNKLVSIVRKSFPSVRATVMRDFFEILKDLDIYERASHNKTEHIYTFPTGSQVEFFSVDDEQKIRGRKRDICWMNEANELFYDDFTQINMRTTFKIIMDYNPSEPSSWIYDLNPTDRVLIKSTFRDNPFLEQSIIKQIEELEFADPEMWAIYGLGERTTSKLNVYTHFQLSDKPKPDKFKGFVYGLDFGYNHPSALVKIWYFENELFVEELIYESYLTSEDLVKRMDELEINKNVEIAADHARPEMIEDIRRGGYFVKEADKSVKKGIDNIKKRKVFIDSNAKNIWKEFENYRFKKKGDSITDEVVKLWDDAMDALRYGAVEIDKSYSKEVRFKITKW